MKILCNFARVILNNVTFKTINADLIALPKHNKLIIKTINFLFTFNNYFIMKYFKLKFLLLFAALAVALPPAWAEELTVAEGNAQSDIIPLNGYDFDNCKKNQQIQMIYPSDMLANINGATITHLKFYTRSGVQFHEGKINVAMGTTTASAFDSNPTPITGLTQVIDGMVVSTTTGEWDLELSTPFTYNGGNLVIEFAQTEDGSWGDTYFYGQERTKASFYATYSAVELTNTYNVASFLPKVTFTYEGGVTPVVTVAKPVFDPVDGTTFEENLTVSLSCITEGATIQYSYNGEYFTDYTEPFVIDETTTVYAKAVLGEVESEVVSATYTKQAATNTASIVFDDNESDGNQDFATMNNGSLDLAAFLTYTTTGADLISGIQCSKVYKGATGLKFSSSSVDGYLIITLAPNWKATKITVNAKKWTSGTGKMQIIAGGKTSSNYTLSADYAGYDLVFDEATSIPTIRISATNRLYVKSITIEYVEDGTVEPTLQEVTLSFPQAAYTTTMGEAFTAPVLTVTPNAAADEVVYSSSNTAVATVAADGTVTLVGAGTTTITASISDSETYEDASASYELTVEEAVQPGSDEYVLVTNINQLAPGKKILFLNANSKNLYAEAMGRQQSNNRKATTVQVSEDKVTSPEADTEILILEKEDDYWLFKTTKWPEGGLGYLYAAGANSNNYLRTEVTADKKAQATVTIANDGEATVVFNLDGDNPRNILRHNSSNSLFNCYNSTGASGQKPVYIYVEKSDEPVVEELTVALDPAEKTYTVGEVAKIMVNVENGNEDTMVSYKINDGEDQDYNAETGIVLPNDKAKEYTVTVYATDGEREATATGTYSFTAAPAFEITLTPNKEGNYTVGDNAVVTVAVDKYIGEDYLVSYTIGDSEEQIEYNAETGIVLPNDKAGDVTVKVYVTDGYEHAGDEFVSATYHFDAAPAIVVTLDPASGNYYLGEQVKVTVTAQNTIGDYEVTYKIGDGEELEYEDGITITSDQEGTVNLTVTVVDGYHDGAATATGAYTFAPRPVATMPVFSLVSGTYGEAQQLTITAEDGATILYSTDGSEPTTEYTNAIDLGEGTTTVKAIAMKDGYTMSPEVSATYIIEIPEELPTITAFDGYYQVKNNGNDKYANIAGRKTLNFTNDIDKAAGTVIRLKTNDKGQVQVLRSQAADLQRYADRAVEYYVPKAVELIAQKLQADGAGNILGENGLDAIMDKFNSSFDHHLYVEQAGEGWRIYGKTPSMQPVVDFYRENTSKVEQKLPMLESFINSALDKLKEKIGGSSVFQPFSLLNIWERMGGTLTKPEDDASIMAFYREVLNNKYYVWDFAYQTATFYIENLKAHPRWPEVQEQLGELAQYIDKIENVRPEFKYYIVQKDGKPDYISEGNADIRNNEPRTIWTVEPRTTFTVNFPEENLSNKMYVTTLYTDFAYDLPEGVTAYKVTEISESSVAKQEAITGTVPAQTPVILMSTTAGDQVLTLNVNDGTRPADNLLQGPDYLVNYYDLKTPQLVNLFAQLKNKLGEDFYNNYVKDYEYLMDLNSGTVNNKYFWNVNANLDKLTDEPIVRDLAVDDMGKLAFSDHWTTENNKAFLVDLQGEHNVIFLSMRGDVNKDGYINITDVTAWIDLKLETTPYQYLEPTAQYPNGLDYEAADYNENGELKVDDLADLIQFILMRDLPEGDNPETPVEP